MDPAPHASSEAFSFFSKLHELSQKALASRGQGAAELTDLLDFSLAKLQDPSSILGMDLAVQRLLQAFLKNESILIYGDYDLDGSSGVCLLKIALDQLGFRQVQVYQPDRHKDGYGVHARLIPELAQQGVSLILTVDVGITATEAAEECLRHHIDLIITDHHLPQDVLPKAHVIVNPNQKGDVSDLKFLCGAGVAFYLVRALKRKWSLENLPHAQLDLKNLLPFVVLSTVTDMVPLIKDNRILVRHGLDAIAKTPLKSWQELLKKFTYGKRKLQVSDVAISIAPKLNALTRMSGELTPVDYLLSNEATLLKERLDYLVQKNKERETEQGLAQNIAQSLAEVRAQHEPFLFVADPNIHLGVLGLVANKIATDDEIPAFVAGKNEEGLFVGSARLPEKLNGSLLDVLGYCSDELIRFGGHSHAAGFMFEESKIEVIQEKLRSFFVLHSLHEREILLQPIAARLEQFFQHEFLRDLEILEPFGKGFEPFLFELKRLQILSVQTIKEKHLKLSVTDEALQVPVTAWLFSATKSQQQLLRQALAEKKTIDVCTHVQLNEFRGRLELQLLLKNVVLS